MKPFTLFAFVLLFFTTSAYSELLDQKKIKNEFKFHNHNKEIKSLNRKLSSRDIVFCNFDLDEKLCLLTLQRERLAIDIENRIIKKLAKDGDEKRLVNVQDAEFELLHFYLEDLVVRMDKVKLKQSKSFASQLSVSSSGIYPNGCGTPSHSSYDWIPDRPYWSACNEHDICYASFTNKSVCDAEFYKDMINIAKDTASDITNDFPIAYEVALGTLTSLAYTYFKVVDSTDTALEAYCEDKGIICVGANGDLNVIDSNGDVISGSGDDGSGNIFPPELYNDDLCLMPFRYYTCAYGRCVGNIMHIPCP